ncbi:MAG TPA: HAMP domain-containing sensor histidine kinase [Verrucomicrobiae bacterium]|nr:HAMP domain-containing sensor histidine kinase [Verrucomicrobiae bacterium]
MKGLRTFRAKLLVAMALVTLAITAFGLFIAERKVAAETEHDLERDFQAALNSLHLAQEIRQATLAERCRTLVRRPRIVAALEDNALDLLYPSAKDELRDLMADPGVEKPAPVVHAHFYRFLNAQGTVISPPNGVEVGELKPEQERQLDLGRLPEQQQIGFLEESGAVTEVFAIPINSSETGETISAMVIGLNASLPRDSGKGMRSGLLLNGRLHLRGLDEGQQAALAAKVTGVISGTGRAESSFGIRLENVPHRLFYKRLNPGSIFPPAHEVCIYPLGDLLLRQETLRWQATGICACLLLGGVAASQYLSGRLSAPVEKLAVDSAENFAQRQRAEAALESTSKELQRAARFSADASHQLKTPVTVLRAGLDELLADEKLSPETREELSALLHQTFRLNTIIEDLLLLSRMDAGRLHLNFTAVNLAQIIEGWLDDFSTLSEAAAIEIKEEVPADLNIAGEKRYTAIIVENLLENARKYNRPGGCIRVAVRKEAERVMLNVANRGNPIPPNVQEHIFERFHRGTAGENVPGYGLGLNIARELARLHGGDLRLVGSDDEWTEFEVSFRLAARERVKDAESA